MRKWWGLLVLGSALAAAFTWWSLERRPRGGTLMRGWELAQQLGCFSCHGPGGTGGLPNPGSEEGEIPAWDGGMLLMYVEDPAEIEEWILYGRPRRLQGRDPADPSRASSGGLITMPPYQGLISRDDLKALVALVQFIGSYRLPEKSPLVEKGLQVARAKGCFACHRQGGVVGTPNPGSWKGYIPPWVGPDFEELVRSDEELREWILEGRLSRLEKNPLARFFTRRQAIQMPAYREWLEEDELKALMAYIRWLGELPR